MLPRPSRVRRPDDFRRIMRRGRKAGRRLLSVHALAANDGASRAGFVVGRSVGGSVERHRVTRRLRHLVADRLRLPARGHRAGGAGPPAGRGGRLRPSSVRTSTRPCASSAAARASRRSRRSRPTTGPATTGPATRGPRRPRGTGRSGARDQRGVPDRQRRTLRPVAGTIDAGTGRGSRDRTPSGPRAVVPRETDGSGRRGDGDTAGCAAARPRHTAGDRAPRRLPALDTRRCSCPIAVSTRAAARTPSRR